MRIVRSLSIILSFLVFAIAASNAYAACDATYMGDAGTFLKDCGASTIGIAPDQGGDGVTSIKALVINFAKSAIEFGALLAIGAMVFSGILYTTSYGDDEKIKKAKMTGVYSLTGLLLLLTAFALVDIVVNFVYSIGG